MFNTIFAQSTSVKNQISKDLLQQWSVTNLYQKLANIQDLILRGLVVTFTIRLPQFLCDTIFVRHNFCEAPFLCDTVSIRHNFCANNMSQKSNYQRPVKTVGLIQQSCWQYVIFVQHNFCEALFCVIQPWLNTIFAQWILSQNQILTDLQKQWSGSTNEWRSNLVSESKATDTRRWQTYHVMTME